MKLGYIKTLKFDLHRYAGKASFLAFMMTYFRYVEFRYIFWFRTSSYTRQHLFLIPLHYFCRYILYRKQISYGICIPYNTEIKEGLYIGHFGNLIIHYQTKIGKNCNLSSGVTIGFSPRGKNTGVPEIGDNVYIGPGAKIIGNLKIGNNIAVGANCVVTKDIPENAVVVGVPGKVISYNGSIGYIHNVIPE